MNYWLIKSEPYKYSWDDLVRDGWTYWDGVRNYAARKNLNAMQIGDLALYYHSNEGKAIVGYTKIIKSSYQDPTTDDDRWVAVDVEPIKAFDHHVTLAEVKAHPELNQSELVRLSRLSVQSFTKAEFELVLKLAKG